MTATQITARWLHGAKGTLKFSLVDGHGVAAEHELPIAGGCPMCGCAIPQLSGRCDLGAHLAQVSATRDARCAALAAVATATGAMLVTGPTGPPDPNKPLTKWVDAAHGVAGFVIVNSAGQESRLTVEVARSCAGCGVSQVLADAAAVTAAVQRAQAEREAYAAAMQAHAAALGVAIK